MATIYITCPHCTTDTSMPARAMLATLDLGDFSGPLGLLSWACLSCGRLVTAEVEATHLLRLITAGVSLLDDGFGDDAAAEQAADSSAPLRPHAQHPGTGPPFTSQDVLTLHELLETDAWVQELTKPLDGSS
jgi:hypothetical protein